MAVYHVLKDGSRPATMRGHVVKLDDAKPLYNAIDSILQRKRSRTVKPKNNRLEVMTS